MPQQPPIKLHLPKIPGALDPDGRFTPLMEARHLQRLIFTQSTGKKVTPVALSHLARAWCAVQDCIRVMKGIPSPGQLRPDLDPVQLSRALKRMKSRKPILDIGDGGSGPSETPAEVPAEKPAKVQASKTPLQTTGLTPKPKDPLDKPPIEERVEPSKASEQSNEDPEP